MTNLLCLIALSLLVTNGGAVPKSAVFFILNGNTDAINVERSLAHDTKKIGCQNTIPENYDMTFLQYYPNLEKLIGQDCDFVTFNFTVYDHYGQLIQLPKMETLKITDGRIEQIGDHSFRSLPNLEKLKLKNNKIERISRDAFADLAKLRKLELPTNRIKTLPVDVFAHLHNLEEVELNENELHKLDLNMFEHNQNLSLVEMADNPLVEIDMFHRCRTLAWFIEINRPNQAQISGTKLNLHKEAALIWSEKMTRIHIVATNYTDTIEVQHKLRALGSIQTLDLSGNGIVALRVKAFEKMTGLTTMHVNNNNMTILDCTMLLNLLPALGHLTLANNLWSCIALTQMIPVLEERKVDFTPVSTVGVNVNGVSCRLNDIAQARGSINALKKYQENGLILSAALSVLMCLLYGVNVCIRTRRGKQLRCCVYVG